MAILRSCLTEAWNVIRELVIMALPMNTFLKFQIGVQDKINLTSFSFSWSLAASTLNLLVKKRKIHNDQADAKKLCLTAISIAHMISLVNINFANAVDCFPLPVLWLTVERICSFLSRASCFTPTALWPSSSSLLLGATYQGLQDNGQSYGMKCNGGSNLDLGITN
jgi:hypothetical protein